MIKFKQYVLLRENAVKTPDELHAMSPEDFANYLDSLVVGIKNSNRVAEILETVIHDASDKYYRRNNNLGTQLWQARRIISKIPPNALKFKKLNSDNAFYLADEFEYVANVNGVPYGLNKWEDPDYDPYGTRDDDEDESEDEDEDGGSKKKGGNLKYVWAYQRIGSDTPTIETVYNIGYGDEDVMKEMQQDLQQTVGM